MRARSRDTFSQQLSMRSTSQTIEQVFDPKKTELEVGPSRQWMKDKSLDKSQDEDSEDRTLEDIP